MPIDTAAILRASKRLGDACQSLPFAAPTHIYNPLEYAWQPHREYITKFAGGKTRKDGKILVLGMNPGPWGMVQTGVPFGNIDIVREWLGINAPVAPPDNIHPRRPITGFQCARREVSGERLWGLFRERFPRAEDFFARYFVANYCPLFFIQDAGKRIINITPDKLPAAESAPLYAACDDFLKTLTAALKFKTIIGVGNFAKQRAAECFADDANIEIGRMLHPSPASPAANRDFRATAIRQLAAFDDAWLSLLSPRNN